MHFPFFFFVRVLTASNKDDTFLLWCRAVLYIKRATRRALSTENVIIIHYLFFFVFLFYRFKKKNSGRRLFPSQFCSRFDNNAAVFFNYLKKKNEYFSIAFPWHREWRDDRSIVANHREMRRKRKIFSSFSNFELFRFHFFFFFFWGDFISLSLERNVILCCTSDGAIWDITSPSKYEFVYIKYDRVAVQYRNPTNRACDVVFTLLDIWCQRIYIS